MKEKILLTYRKGITHTPSDMLCDDGELEECVNLEVKGQELVPMEMPVKLGFSLGSNERLLLVHNIGTGEKNYITSVSGTLKAFAVSNGSKNYYSLSKNVGEVKSIQSIGNTIVVYTEDSPHYFIFSEDDYKYIGSSMPELGLSFNLKGHVWSGKPFSITVENFSRDNKIENMNGLPDDIVDSITEQIIGEVNKFINEYSTLKGEFMYPFFVRYAYVLYDGTHTMQSAPILMLPSTLMSPICRNRSWEGEDLDDAYRYSADVSAYTAKLVMNVVSDLSEISSWKDIIKGVDIFVSSPIYTYDQNGQVKRAVKNGNGRAFNTEFHGSTGANDYARYNMLNVIAGSDANAKLYYIWELPEKDLSDVCEEISACSLFYKYVSFSIEDLEDNSSMVIDNEELNVNPIAGIEVGETLKDDYMTHDRIVPESSFVYNKRLNVSNITRYLFDGFSADCIAQPGMPNSYAYTTRSVEDNPDEEEEPDGDIGGGDYVFPSITDTGMYDIYTFIRSQGGNDIVVKSTSNQPILLYGTYLFYPDTDAYKMVIVNKTSNEYAEVSLSEHKGLNGAFAFSSFQPLTFKAGRPTYSGDSYERSPNKLFVSELNNPFYFPLEGMYTVGSGNVIGMAAVTKPISQGQFGEYPLIMFCTDGNYAMRVDEQGFYAAISPVQEDVVLGNDKITPMENSVVIITKKGIMLTAGGEMQKIAAQMDGGVFNVSSLDRIGTSVAGLSSIASKGNDVTGFLSYVYGARMAFDYASNRLFVYHPDKSYSYVYNFGNDTLTKMVLPSGVGIVTSVMDYPDTIIQDASGNLYSLYTKEDVSVLSDKRYGFAVTRPLKMGAALSLKAVKQVMNLAAYADDSFVKYQLYGSNDNVNYYKISSRFGKPYKYYRVAIYTYILPKESVSGTAMIVEPRRDHKLR